jgi:DNA-directed RNA polymerase specialized sigma24 family protein
MTPTEEARFIALWHAGTETAAIAQALGIPRGTVSSRASALRAAGEGPNAHDS